MADPPVLRGLTQQRRLQKIRSIEGQLEDIEARRHISERWTADTEQYKAAGEHCKVLQIQRCESSLHTLFVRHHALHREYRDAPRRERQATVQLRKNMEGLQQKATLIIQDLEAWHAAPGRHQLCYDPSSLDAGALLSADFLTWQQGSVSGDLLKLKTAKSEQLAQQRQRCVEEVQIVKREAADMVAFYEHYEAEISAQVVILQTAEVNVQRLPSEYHADSHDSISCRRHSNPSGKTGACAAHAQGRKGSGEEVARAEHTG